jgi:hypothetical protein
MEATDLEANPEEKEIAAEQQQVPKEDAVVKNCQSTEELEWGLVSSHRAPLTAEEMEPGIGGFWKKLPAAHRGMTRHAGVA